MTLGRKASILLEDIAEIVAYSKDSEIRRNIIRYLSKLRKPCPTPNCEHMLSELAWNCHGYKTKREIIRVEGADRAVSEVESNPLVIDVFCSVFCQLGKGKEPCKACMDSGFAYKTEFSGLYCHGCSFFVDFYDRTVGYSREWTMSTGRFVRLGLSCQYCGSDGVSAKFGDYWFCDAYCMQRWCLSIGSIPHQYP